ncbi:MAG: MutS family DNA mismatch repair protein, partial [Chitinispirillaceae bacterium]
GDHLYAYDLDIFGKGSLYQHICCAHTFRGREALASLLSENEPAPQIIQSRQEAVKELGGKLEWRQMMEAKAVLEEGYREDPRKLVDWMKSDRGADLLSKRVLLSATPFLALIASYLLFSFTSVSLLLFLFIPVNLSLYFTMGRRVSDNLDSFDNYERSIGLYASLLKMMEKEEFESRTLKKIREELSSRTHTPPSKAVAEFNRRLSLSQIRHNKEVGFVLNLFFLWDFQCLFSLLSWRSKFGASLEKWIGSIAQMEAFSSLSVLQFENPQWSLPRISSEHEGFTAKELGHPLIHRETRVSNDISIPSQKTVTIITGSNMSGKTTFLRTIGVNLVLAYAGAPVCAEELQSAPIQIFSTMRINDNLQEGISTFYFELLKIKKILENAKDQPSLVLVDEIFRGTNSRDRHTAAVIVLRQLLRRNALTVISTHDYELTSLEKKDPETYRNYHFKDDYSQEGISFSYRLHPGASKQSNALALVKLAGIEVDENGEYVDG